MNPNHYSDKDRARLGTELHQSYLLESILGKGGTAIAYLARDLRHRRRKVTVKILEARFHSDQHVIRRFLREAEALKRMNGHRNIVRVYECCATGDEIFLVTEYAKGETLRELINRGVVSPAKIITIMSPIMDGLHAAHMEGIVHRDVKPENIIVGKVPKLLDLGIAKLFQPFVGDEETLTALTRHDQMLGTPDYSAPEQKENPANIDRRVDIYSTACVFYEALAGHRPSHNRRGRSITPLHIIRPEISEQFSNVVAMGMAENRDDRPNTIVEFSQLLSAALDPTSVTPKPSTSVMIEVKKRRRKAHIRISIELELNKPLSLTHCLKQEAARLPLMVEMLQLISVLFDPADFTGHEKHLTVEFRRDSLVFTSYPKPIVLNSNGMPLRIPLVLEDSNRSMVVEYWPAGFCQGEKRFVLELSYGDPVRLRLYELRLYEKTSSIIAKSKREPLLEFFVTRKPSRYLELRPRARPLLPAP